jgi:hypothetical protein
LAIDDPDITAAAMRIEGVDEDAPVYLEFMHRCDAANVIANPRSDSQSAMNVERVELNDTNVWSVSLSHDLGRITRDHSADDELYGECLSAVADIDDHYLVLGHRQIHR